MTKIADIISTWAQKGATISEHGRMCNECAFRRGSVAQSEPHNVDAAANALAFYGQFNCHVNEFEDAGKPCVGFLYAKAWCERDQQTIHNTGSTTDVDN